MHIGIIGTGNIARFHLQGYQAAGAKVVAVADLNEANASLMASQANACSYSDYKEMLARPDIDAVSVCLPNHLHYLASIDALRAGKHVLCEKPMTTTLDDACRLTEAVTESGKCFQVAYMKRFLPAFQIAKQEIAGIGNVLSATVKVFHWFPETMWVEAGQTWWGLGKDTAGGGPLVHAGSHIIDVLGWWFGPAAQVRATVRQKAGMEVDDHTAATFIMSSGLTIFFECGWLPLSHIGLFKDGWDERIEVTGDRGRVELFSTWWDRPQMTPCVRVYKEGEPTREIYTEPVNAFIPEVAQFVKTCQNGAKASPSVEDGLAVQQIIQAIYTSSERRETVSLKEYKI